MSPVPGCSHACHTRVQGGSGAAGGKWRRENCFLFLSALQLGQVTLLLFLSGTGYARLHRHHILCILDIHVAQLLLRVHADGPLLHKVVF